MPSRWGKIIGLRPRHPAGDARMEPEEMTEDRQSRPRRRINGTPGTSPRRRVFPGALPTRAGGVVTDDFARIFGNPAALEMARRVQEVGRQLSEDRRAPDEA